MNKRDFIVQGGSALLGSSTLGSAWAAGATTVAASSTTSESLTPAATTAQASWDALLGQAFTGQTTLGRSVALTLHKVSGKATGTSASMEQFTVSFQGPRALPLKTGSHQLTHPQTGTVRLYLEAVHQGEHMLYDAHFSLLA
ncbi:MAG: hypothetical protein EPO09_07160 [Aquabacterium sp.]|uniref:DUF6916 family protein n=1 Tax=Aquabacterium sp. TaxID=1872578 RepID=UPI0012195BB7|nr:hypothetical protein [Aquabacterium sp.]TAK95931.1 MAG: hypothetical protein EPO09_07160 [Aquabacterium sp.]